MAVKWINVRVPAISTEEINNLTDVFQEEIGNGGLSKMLASTSRTRLGRIRCGGASLAASRGIIQWSGLSGEAILPSCGVQGLCPFRSFVVPGLPPSILSAHPTSIICAVEWQEGR